MRERLLLLLVGFFLSAASAWATPNDVHFTGSVSWSISGTSCTLTSNGNIQNYNPGGSLSGTLRLALWMTKTPFPSTGYRIATYTLGQLQGGYYYNPLSRTVTCTRPNVTGFYYYTMVLEQYDNGGWKTSDAISTGQKYMKNGAFAAAPPRPKWVPSAAAIKTPPSALKVGNTVTITIKSTDGVNLVPVGTVLKFRFKITANGETVVYGGSKPEGAPAKYTYSQQVITYKGKKIKVGRLKLDYGIYYGMTSYSINQLYFQSASGGFYKSTEVDPSGGGKTGGIFTYK